MKESNPFCLLSEVLPDCVKFLSEHPDRGAGVAATKSQLGQHVLLLGESNKVIYMCLNIKMEIIINWSKWILWFTFCRIFGLSGMIDNVTYMPSIPPALSVSNMPKPPARTAAQLFPGGWSDQPTPLWRNALPLSHPAARARGTFVQYRSLCGPEDQESCGGWRSGRPLA